MDKNTGVEESTLKRIYDLRYNCYVLKVDNGVPDLIKLETKKGNPKVDKRINKTLKRLKIKTHAKTWRVMNCIVKPFKSGPSFASEWKKLLPTLNLPDGSYVLSLSDSVLMPTSIPGPPVFAYSGKQGYRDIPIPNYDDLFDRDIGDVQTNWSEKKPIAVFRGSSTGCGRFPDTNMRLKISQLKLPDLDAGVTKYTNQLKEDPVHGLGYVQKGPLATPLTWYQQSMFKYIVHIDGNVVAYRLLKSMLTKSLILRVKSEFKHWADTLLKPGVHYIEVKADLSNLEDQIQWCKTHDTEAKAIADAGYTFAKNVLTDEYLISELRRALKTSSAYRIPNM